jgi:hypothetical protein
MGLILWWTWAILASPYPAKGDFLSDNLFAGVVPWLSGV